MSKTNYSWSAFRVLTISFFTVLHNVQNGMTKAMVLKNDST